MPNPVLDLKKNQREGAPAQPELKRSVQGGEAVSPQAEAVKPKLPESFLWNAPEFSASAKGLGWHAGLWVAAAGMVIAMVFLKNYTAAAFFIIAAFVISLYANKEPRVLEFGITPKGVQVGDRVYLYEDLRSFWIYYEKGVRSELSLRSTRVLMPYIIVPLGDVNPAKVHAVLSRYLPERKHSDSVVDAVARKSGF